MLPPAIGGTGGELFVGRDKGGGVDKWLLKGGGRGVRGDQSSRVPGPRTAALRYFFFDTASCSKRVCGNQESDQKFFLIRALLSD